MKVLVYPHDLEIGGSQLNAIELAAEVAAAGHEVVVFGRPGRLLGRIDELGLAFIEAVEPSRRPSRVVVDQLSELINERGIEILHGYEWPPTLECWWAAARAPRARVVSTVMSMAVAPFLPRNLELLVGTEQIAAVERARGRRRVDVLEPPVDLRHADECRPAATADFATAFDLDPAAVTVVTVTRLVPELKLEGLLTAIATVGDLNASDPLLQLVVVGGGSAETEVRAAAHTANQRQGRQVVVLTGELDDPRPAYAAADVVLGMGGSALRAMAHGRPLIVQGEQGFWRLLDEQSSAEFAWTGWYGLGPGVQSGSAELLGALRPVLHDPRRRAELGSFGRRLVEDRYSLAAAAERQLSSYHAALSAPPSQRATALETVRCGTRFVSHKGYRKLTRMLGRARTDDFNARPAAAGGPRRPAMSTAR